jgi:hypothetical protein
VRREAHADCRKNPHPKELDGKGTGARQILFAWLPSSGFTDVVQDRLLAFVEAVWLAAARRVFNLPGEARAGVSTTTIVSKVSNFVELCRTGDQEYRIRNLFYMQAGGDPGGSQQKGTRAEQAVWSPRAATVETAASVELFKPVVQAWFT